MLSWVAATRSGGNATNKPQIATAMCAIPATRKLAVQCNCDVIAPMASGPSMAPTVAPAWTIVMGRAEASRKRSTITALMKVS